MIDALKLIIARSPAALQQAMQCMRAINVKSPMVQGRYNRVAEMAFNDPQAEFSPADRELIAGYMAGEDEDEARTLDLRVRVNAVEKAEIQQAAGEAGQNVSDFIRARIGL